MALPATAFAGWGSCALGDAPAGFFFQPCRGLCTESGSSVTCELDTVCTTGAEARIVTGYGASTHDLSFWGSCGGTYFCCVFDEGATNIDTVELNGVDRAGGAGNDDLSFQFDVGQPSERNLEPWDGDPITGVIRGNEGTDSIEGSNYAGSDYDESLYGQRGNDIVRGYGGADVCDGGEGNDIL